MFGCGLLGQMPVGLIVSVLHLSRKCLYPLQVRSSSWSGLVPNLSCSWDSTVPAGLIRICSLAS